MKDLILVINPGSTSTKVAIFEDMINIKQNNIEHSVSELATFEKITDQFSYRKEAILSWMKNENIEQSRLAAVVGRGGLLKPMPSGTYEVTEAMIDDLKVGVQGEHASNLGGIIAKEIAAKWYKSIYSRSCCSR